jgi:rare lipoprotein A
MQTEASREAGVSDLREGAKIRRTSCCATVARSHVIATALLQLILFEPTRADDAKPDECGIASVYSTLSEETASGQDTSVNDRTAARRSLPFGTLVRVDNQENGQSSRPVRQWKNNDLSQIAAHELGFADLTKVCLKILWLLGT